MSECEICGSTGHADDSEAAHGAALCVYQPSLHNEQEWVSIVVGEAETFARHRGPSESVKVRGESLAREWADAKPDDEYFSEACDDFIRDAESIIADCGLIVYSDNDSWLVFEPAKEPTQP